MILNDEEYELNVSNDNGGEYSLKVEIESLINGIIGEINISDIVDWPAEGFSLTTHVHTGVYEPADSAIQTHLSNSDIHVTTADKSNWNSKASGDHNHDLLYAALVHDHDGVYSHVSHNHDTDYASITHAHDGLYEPANSNIQGHISDSDIHVTSGDKSSWNSKADGDHNHDTVYSAIGHNHDSTYSLLGHDHDTEYSPFSHNHNGIYSLIDHTHSGVYEPANSNIQSHITDTDIHVTLSNKSNWDSKASEDHNHDSIYSAIGHDHSGTYEPANANIQSHITNGDIHVTLSNKTLWDSKAAGDHDHDLIYSLISHNHNGVYEPANSNIQTHISDNDIHVTLSNKTLWNSKADGNHNHDSVYSSISHNHDSDYADISHNHDTVYSAIDHNHDSTYALISHQHTISQISDWPAQGYSLSDHNHNTVYATVSHNHDGTYSAISHTHDNYLSKFIEIRNESSTFTISDTDNQKLIRYTGSSDVEVVINDSLTVGTVISFRQASTGIISFASGTGSPVLNGDLTSNGQYAVVQVIKVAAGVFDIISGVEGTTDGGDIYITDIQDWPSQGFSLSDHNHNSTYSPISHNHDTVYSAIDHNHDSTYEPANANIQSHIANTDVHVTTSNKSDWDAKASTAYVDTAEADANSYTDSEISGLSTVYEPANANIQSHIADTDIHVTTGDKTTWNAKASTTYVDQAETDANSYTDAEISGLSTVYEPKNSNIQSHIVDTDIHVTLSNKSNWDSKAAGDHNHDAIYAAIAHDHDSAYAAIGHDHDTVYAPISHNHAGTYEPANSNIQNHILDTDIHVTTGDKTNWDSKAAGDHNHDLSYSPLGHMHDGVYSPVSHNHDATYIKKLIETRTESTGFTLSNTDNQKLVRYTGATDIEVAVDDSLTNGTVISIRQCGAGIITLAPGTGTPTLNGDLTSNGLYSVLQIIKVSAGNFDIISGVEATGGTGDIYIADIIDWPSQGFSLSDHDHDAVYAAIGHDHDSTYAAISHDHTGVYEPANANIQSHIADSVIHVTLSDKESWNNAEQNAKNYADAIDVQGRNLLIHSAGMTRFFGVNTTSIIRDSDDLPFTEYNIDYISWINTADESYIYDRYRTYPTIFEDRKFKLSAYIKATAPALMRFRTNSSPAWESVDTNWKRITFQFNGGSGETIRIDSRDTSHSIRFYACMVKLEFGDKVTGWQPAPEDFFDYSDDSEQAAKDYADANFASTSHNHDGVYAPVSHDHDSAYASISHDHDSQYSAIAHNHDGTYEPANANIQTHIADSDIHVTTADKTNWNSAEQDAKDYADATFAVIGHNHDSAYAAVSHNHDGVYSTVGHDHNTEYAALSHNHDGVYATASHDHDSTYAAISHNHNGVYEPANSNIQTHIVDTNVHVSTEDRTKLNSFSALGPDEVTFNQSIPFTQQLSVMTHTQTANIIFTPNTTGATDGFRTRVTITGDSSHSITFSGFRKSGGSLTIDNTKINSIIFWKEGTNYWYRVYEVLNPASGSGAPAITDNGRIFPGAVGYGTDRRGAYQGSSSPTILIVDTLSSANEQTGTNRGTFRWCCERTFPRVILFEVSGVINYTGVTWRIKIENPYMTIYGQTAPAKGVTIRGATFWIETSGSSDILIQHMKFLPGDQHSTISPNDVDGIDLYTGSNVVIDHCTLGWSQDEVAGLESVTSNVTFSNCMFKEPLDRAGHYEDSGGTRWPERHPYCCLCNASNTTFYRNLFGYSYGRNPLIRNGNNQIINNYVYATRWAPVMLENTTGDIFADVVNNVTEIFDYDGITPATDGIAYIASTLTSSSRLYVSGNVSKYTIDNPSASQWDAVTYNSRATQSATPNTTLTSFDILDASAVKAHVLANAGAFYWNRGDDDIQFINKINAATDEFLRHSALDYPATARNLEGTATSGDMQNGHDWSSSNQTLRISYNETSGGSILGPVTVNLTANCTTINEVVSHLNSVLPTGLEAVIIGTSGWLSDLVCIRTTHATSTSFIEIHSDGTGHGTLGIAAGEFWGQSNVSWDTDADTTTLSVPASPHADGDSNNYTDLQEWAYDMGYPAGGDPTPGKWLGTLAALDVWQGTQAQYDALGTYDNGTLYLIEAT